MSANPRVHAIQVGYLAVSHCGIELPLQVLSSAAGYYLGTEGPEYSASGSDLLPGEPISRESIEYWPTQEEATNAMHAGKWTQRHTP